MGFFCFLLKEQNHASFKKNGFFQKKQTRKQVGWAFLKKPGFFSILPTGNDNF